MSQAGLRGTLVRWREKAAERRRLEIERSAGPHPRAGHWYVLGDMGHLYLRTRDEPPAVKPICGIASIEGARQMDINAGDTICPACDTYQHDVYLPQIG